jgi:DNA-binding CsgD family transcriptional regulator
MGRALLTAYYAVFYSVGVASLVYALILRASGKERLLGRFIACTAAMTAVMLSNAVQDALGDSIAPALRDALRWTALALLAAYAYALAAFAAEVFPFGKAAAVKRAFAAFAATGLALVAAGAFAGGGPWVDAFVLALKDAAIVFAVALALLPRSRERPGGPDRAAAAASYRTFFRIASFPIAFVIPFMLWEEIASLLAASAFPVKGSLSLPACYGVWSTAFIATRLRPRTPAQAPEQALAAGATPDREFIERRGVTPREAEVLVLLLRGLDYKRIMADLSISMPTVKSHVSSIYRKTGTANRLELAALIQKNEVPGV